MECIPVDLRLFLGHLTKNVELVLLALETDPRCDYISTEHDREEENFHQLSRWLDSGGTLEDTGLGEPDANCANYAKARAWMKAHADVCLRLGFSLQ